MKNVLKILPVLILASCVDSGSDSNSDSSGGRTLNQNEVIAVDGSNVKGHYAAEIWPMNYNLHFKTIGVVGVSRDGDEFKAAVNMKYGPKETTVRQAIYTARRCPNLTDDLNKDAYIDILEARLAIGKITIPFDTDLNSQMGGHNQYPTVNSSGKMFYTQTASFDLLFEDLKSSDEDPSDDMIKLKPQEGITFPGRIVLFQGVPRKVQLPESVGTTDGLDRNESLPVGCAVLWKVKEMPKELVSETTDTI